MDLDPAAVAAAAKAIDGALLEFAFYQTSITIDGEALVAAKAALTAAAPFIVRATADAIADKIEATETALAVIYDPVREPARLSAARYTLGCAAEIARSFGRTPETDTTEATE